MQYFMIYIMTIWTMMNHFKNFKIHHNAPFAKWFFT